ncbi:NUDIX domain-containing protein [Marisediminicola sp. LYQ134]|uniref:NUDIX domain-containing protein n=1 Tax=unclassified Marisediminicola TaxID=2618316 RepID=UPI003983A76B
MSETPSPATSARDEASAVLADDIVEHAVTRSTVEFDGAVWNIRRDVVEFGDSSITREYVEHTGAVAVLALDDDDRVMLIKQYRHPISRRDWELPAGLLDEANESPLAAAKRELAEEVDLEATTWHVLTDFFTTPGGSNEALRVFLARGVSSTATPFDRFDEEAEIETRWVALDEVVDAVLARTVSNSILSIAALAAASSRSRAWSTLGDADAPWPFLRRAQGPADPDPS